MQNSMKVSEKTPKFQVSVCDENSDYFKKNGKVIEYLNEDDYGKVLVYLQSDEILCAFRKRDLMVISGENKGFRLNIVGIHSRSSFYNFIKQHDTTAQDVIDLILNLEDAKKFVLDESVKEELFNFIQENKKEFWYEDEPSYDSTDAIVEKVRKLRDDGKITFKLANNDFTYKQNKKKSSGKKVSKTTKHKGKYKKNFGKKRIQKKKPQ